MGILKHHALLITTWEDELIREAHAFALDLFPAGHVALFTSPGLDTLAISPDHSKDGRPESNAGDLRRQRMIDWLEERRYGDGSSAFHWVEVEYGEQVGGQDRGARISDSFVNGERDE
jgi:hypothetical protein